MKDQDKQYILDLVSNIEGASYALGEYAQRYGDGMTPYEEDISEWKQAGRPDEFKGFDREAWELANELRKYKRKLRRIVVEL